MTFPEINGPSGPEEYSWEVSLEEGERLELTDEQHAQVYYESGHPAYGITAEEAHDAVGSTVPTSLAVSEGDVITLIVHHRAGDVAAGGAPFVYPVTSGPGWEGGFHTIIVEGPKDEQELREERERIAREEYEALERSWEQGSSARCLVPRLEGRSLNASKKLLIEANCRIGEVTVLSNASARTGKAVRQSPKPGRLLRPRATVDVTLGGTSSGSGRSNEPHRRRAPAAVSG